MTPSEIRFATDGMLQSLGTWLRLLGYDCLGDSGCWGRRLFAQAVAEDRVFLTRNTHLADSLPHALLARANVVFVSVEHLPEQLHEVTAKFALDGERFAFTRCVLCNQPLRTIAAASVESAVPAAVAASRTEYWRCDHCAKTYWRGSHVRRSLEQLHVWLNLPRAATAAAPEKQTPDVI